MVVGRVGRGTDPVDERHAGGEVAGAEAGPEPVEHLAPVVETGREDVVVAEAGLRVRGLIAHAPTLPPTTDSGQPPGRVGSGERLGDLAAVPVDHDPGERAVDERQVRRHVPDLEVPHDRQVEAAEGVQDGAALGEVWGWSGA